MAITRAASIIEAGRSGTLSLASASTRGPPTWYESVMNRIDARQRAWCSATGTGTLLALVASGCAGSGPPPADAAEPSVEIPPTADTPSPPDSSAPPTAEREQVSESVCSGKEIDLGAAMKSEECARGGVLPWPSEDQLAVFTAPDELRVSSGAETEVTVGLRNLAQGAVTVTFPCIGQFDARILVGECFGAGGLSLRGPVRVVLAEGGTASVPIKVRAVDCQGSPLALGTYEVLLDVPFPDDSAPPNSCQYEELTVPLEVVP